MPSAAEFTITRILDAPRSLVWRAWTEEEELAHWLHPFGVSTDSISFDVRVGGHLAYTMTDEQTELVLHLRGIAGEPGDGFVYDGWDEALTNFALHVEGLSRG